MCFCGNLMEGDKEEAGKEKVVVERRSDLRTMMVDGGIEEAAMVSLLVSLWSERERIEFCVFCILSLVHIAPRGQSSIVRHIYPHVLTWHIL